MVGAGALERMIMTMGGTRPTTTSTTRLQPDEVPVALNTRNASAIQDAAKYQRNWRENIRPNFPQGFDEG